MKTKTILSIIAIPVLLGSCLVNSLHPFYNKEDVYFDENILGTWLDQDSAKWYIEKMYVSYGEGSQKKEYKTNGYTVRYNPRYKMNKNREEPYTEIFTDFDVFLFKINNQLYADFTPTMFPTFETMGNNFSKLHNIRTHTLAKVIKNDNSFELIWFNGLWLAELIDNNRIKISHEFIPFSEPYSQYYKGQYVLTAKTSELQSFIKKYGNDPNAFVRKKEHLKDGEYKWNVGPDKYTGKMHFSQDSIISYNYILKKLDDSKN